jgi:hypothetical protein
MPPPALLLFGATGKTGRHILARAVEQGWRVVAYVRRPERVPPDLRARVTVVPGDLRDAPAVTAAVRAAAADAIIDASSNLPAKRGEPANNCDRSLLFRAVVGGLEAEGRLGACTFIALGGVLLAEPGGAVTGWPYVAIAALLRLLVPAMFRDARMALAYLFGSTPPAFSFTLVRMGLVAEAPSRGVLAAEATQGGRQRGTLTFGDVATALMALAAEAPPRWSRKAVFLNYAPR